jgi:hypothetical protein
MKVVKSSSLRTVRLYPQKFSSYSFLEAESTPGYMVPSVGSEKIPSDTTGHRSRDLPTSSAVQLDIIFINILGMEIGFFIDSSENFVRTARSENGVGQCIDFIDRWNGDETTANRKLLDVGE